ncbi:hypothetical protein KR222_000356 [Zaprionus bogoriensis]|nr:hypothetical protein KR222_000356 [Zaprionus bogoriensis]
MLGITRELLAFGHLNCIKRCSALIENQRQRNFLTAAALLGLYCGVIVYRTYTKYLDQVEARKEETARLAGEIEVDGEDENVLLEPPPTTSDLQLPPIPVGNYSNVPVGPHDSSFLAALGDD